MTTLENKLAELLLETAIKRIEDASTVSSLVASYQTLISASGRNSWNHRDTKSDCAAPAETGDEPVIDADKTTVTEFCKTVVSTLAPEPDKPATTRTRRTKAQIEADNAAAAAATAPEPETPATVPAEEPAAEPEAEEVQIDDVVEPEAPKITHGKIQELFTLKSTNIAKAGGDVSGFKTKLREMLAEFGSPAGISKLPEANLAAFHAKLVNLT